MPTTVALHCDVAPTTTVAGMQVTDTDVIEGGAACTVIAADPDFAVLPVLVAVTVTLPAEAGAVRSPLELIVPALADHVTAEL